MSGGRFWKFLDEGNQRAADYIRERPESGQKVLPYAKSDAARRLAIWVLVGVGVIGFFAGVLWALAAALVALPFLGRLEHHFFFQRSESEMGDGQEKADES